MREYEAVFILTSKLSKDDAQKLVDEMKKSIESASGEKIVEEKIEKRPLQFPIKREKEGIYVICKFIAPPDAIEKVKEDFKHNESVLRYTFLVADKKEQPGEGAAKES